MSPTSSPPQNALTSKAKGPVTDPHGGASILIGASWPFQPPPLSYIPVPSNPHSQFFPQQVMVHSQPIGETKSEPEMQDKSFPPHRSWLGVSKPRDQLV